MKLFEVRNYISILTAKQIIKDEKIKDYKFFIPFHQIEYLNKMLKILNVSNDKIIIFNTNIYSGKNRWRFYLAEKELKHKTKDCQEIYLCNTLLVEKHLYEIFKRKKKKIIYFEEGMNCYFDYFGKVEKKVPFKLAAKIHIASLLIPKYTKLLYTKFNYDEVNLNFPKAYKYNNYKKIKKIQLSFPINQQRTKIENLFLTRPLSEDWIISEDVEIELIVSFIKQSNFKEIVFKHHPRESEAKINKIKNKVSEYGVEIKTLEIDCPAEELVSYYDIKKIIGFETGTLVYLSEIYNVQACSLLKSAV
ncbi:MAG: polysialyltransferase family glycosyltransferase, partial [Cetobacterium sp.]